MYKNDLKKRLVRFRQFQNKSYSSFNSLGKVIKICTIALSYIMIVSPLKARTTTDSLIVLSPEYSIEEVTIAGSRSELEPDEVARVINIVPATEIESSPSGCIGDYLDYVPGIDIKTRGATGNQSDVSIRGGYFEQTLILLNGVKISDPQTGHNSLNLPVDLNSTDKIEIIKGPSSRIFGANASSGAINIVTKPKKENSASLGFINGDYNLNSIYGTINNGNKRFQQSLNINYLSSDGYSYNTDVKKYNIFYMTRLYIFKGFLDLQAGYADKGAGSQNFYSLAYPAQYEKTRAKFASLSFETGSALKIKPLIYVRRGYDRFELYREGNLFYSKENGLFINHLTGDTAASFYKEPNYHMNTALGAENDVTYTSPIGATTLGMEYRKEDIYSNKMGDLTDTIDAPGEKQGKLFRYKARESASLYLEQKSDIGKFKLNAGLMAMWNSDFDWNLYPGIDIKYDYNKYINQFATVNKAVRLPSFTELYYNTPTHTSDPGLKPERILSYETGFYYNYGFISGYASVFARKGQDLIDWLKDTTSLGGGDINQLKWESRNITKSTTYGYEVYIKADIGKIVHENFILKNISAGYSYLSTSTSSGQYISAYILDYLKHKMNLIIVAGWKGLQLNVTGSYFERNSYIDQVSGQKIKFDPYFLCDAKLLYKHNNTKAFIEVNNLFDTKYYDYHKIGLPGRWVKVGLEQKINLGYK